MILNDVGSIVANSKITEGFTLFDKRMTIITKNAPADFTKRLNKDEEETSISETETSKKGSSR